MKKAVNIFFIISILFFLGSVYWIFFVKSEIAEVKVKDEVIDIGERSPKQRIDVTFEIVNLNSTELEINRVEADCHCTVPILSQKIYKRGEKAKIRTSYYSENKGYFQQSIKVYANVKNSPIILLLQGKTINNESIDIIP